MGDDERAVIGKVRRATPPHGYPAYVDPEATPPPQEPPRPESLPGYSTISPVVRDQLDQLADGLGSLTTAVGRIWDARHDPIRLQRLEDKLDGFAKETAQHSAQLDEFVMPAVKSLMGRVDVLLSGQDRRNSQLDQFFEREWPRHEKLLDGLAKSLTDLVERLGRVETSKEKLTDNYGSLSLRLNTAETKNASLEQRLTALELDKRDAEAGDRRQAKLFSWARAGFLGVVAAVGFVSGHLGTIANWFRK